MKINFWQALGIVLIIVGGIFFLRGKISKDQTAKPTGGGDTPPALTQPAADSGGDVDADVDADADE